MSSGDLIALLGVLVALAFGIVAVVLAYPPFRSAKKELAPTPPLGVTLNGCVEGEILYICPFTQRQKISFDLIISVQNQLTESCRDCLVTLDIPDDLYVGEVERAGDNLTKLMKIERVVDPIDGTLRVRVCWFIPIIHQGVINILDQFRMSRETYLKSTTKATTADNKIVSVDWEVQFDWRVEITIQASDRPATLRKFNISLFKPQHKALRFFDRDPVDLAVHDAIDELKRVNFSLVTGYKLKETERWVPHGISIAGARHFDIDRAERLRCVHVRDLGYVRADPDIIMHLDRRKRDASLAS